MEVLIGFAVGYWVGTRQGREGLQHALDSAQAIWASPESRRLVSEGLTAFEAVAAPAMDRLGAKSNGRRAALISTVVDELIERRARRAA
ncbi:MAG: hypothetical protein ACRDOH_17940 [Streptosporangiaceae bacterium]